MEWWRLHQRATVVFLHQRSYFVLGCVFVVFGFGAFFFWLGVAPIRRLTFAVVDSQLEDDFLLVWGSGRRRLEAQSSVASIRWVPRC